MSKVPFGLAAFVKVSPSAAEILSGTAGYTETAELINAMPEAIEAGFSTTRDSVRRWREKPALPELVAPTTQKPPRVPARGAKVPSWSVGSEIDVKAGEGVLRTRPVPVGDQVDPEDERILAQFNLDPLKWEIASYRESRWQQREDGEELSAYRVSVRKRPQAVQADQADVEAILSRYAGRTAAGGGEKTLLVVISDTQAGKINYSNNGGTPELVERFGDVIEQVRHRIETEFGSHLHKLVLALGGDLIEGCTSQGGKLPLDADVTASVRLMRRLILHAVATLAPLADRVLVAACPGNHGRVRMDPTGTKVTDNWDTEIVVQVADMLEMDPAKYGHVDFAFPAEGEPWVVVNVGDDVPLALALVHGDQARPEKLPDWLNRMAGGREQPGMADAVITGHYHNYQLRNLNGNRAWLQAPAMDGGSDWFRHKTASNVPSGIVSAELVPGGGFPVQAPVFHTAAADTQGLDFHA